MGKKKLYILQLKKKTTPSFFRPQTVEFTLLRNKRVLHCVIYPGQHSFGLCAQIRRPGITHKGQLTNQLINLNGILRPAKSVDKYSQRIPVKRGKLALISRTRYVRVAPGFYISKQNHWHKVAIGQRRHGKKNNYSAAQK
jgi:hypothetical protein